MRRLLFLVTAVFATAALAAPAAFASSPHFKKGGSPVCTITGNGSTSASTTCSATMAGLGNADVQADLSVNGFALYQCQNGGGNTAPGQNRVLEGPATSTTTFPASAIKNGNLSITTNPAVLTAPATVSGATAGCPNANWTGVNPTLTVTDISLVISQPPGTAIFTCTASNPNGLTSPVALSC
jgi:hypothetical protein